MADADQPATAADNASSTSAADFQDAEEPATELSTLTEHIRVAFEAQTVRALEQGGQIERLTANLESTQRVLIELIRNGIPQGGIVPPAATAVPAPPIAGPLPPTAVAIAVADAADPLSSLYTSLQQVPKWTACPPPAKAGASTPGDRVAASAAHAENSGAGSYNDTTVVVDGARHALDGVASS